MGQLRSSSVSIEVEPQRSALAEQALATEVVAAGEPSDVFDGEQRLDELSVRAQHRVIER